MKKFDKYDLIGLLYITGIVICVLILIGYVSLYVYCMVEYGDKPITEIPSWVYFILHNNGGSN